MKKLLVLLLVIFLSLNAKITDRLAVCFSEYCKGYLRGTIKFSETPNENQSFYLYKDGKYIEVKPEDPAFTIQASNADTINFLFIAPEADNIKIESKEKNGNTVTGFKLIGNSYKFFILEKKDLLKESPKNLLSSWSITESKLGKGSEAIIPNNTLIIPFHSENVDISMENNSWKRSSSTAMLPSITINCTKQKTQDLLVKGCLFFMNFGQFHQKQKIKRIQIDNGEILFPC